MKAHGTQPVLCALLLAAVFIVQPTLEIERASATPPAGHAKEDEEPLFMVKEKGKFGFINAIGEMVIQPQYDDCHYQFSEGMAAVKVGETWGFIDRLNRMVIQPQFDSACAFQGGLAAVGTGQPFVGERKWGYVNKTGQYEIAPRNDLPYSGFHDGRLHVKREGKWGYLDRTGEEVIACRYADANPFSEGLAAVQLNDHEGGFIHPDGTWAIRLKGVVPHRAYGFSDGLAGALDTKAGKFGFINKQGDFVIPPQFDDVCEFHEGRAPVCMKSRDAEGWPIRRWGVIDRTGRLIVPAIYETIWDFEEGMAKAVAVGKFDMTRDGDDGFLDLDGRLAIPCRFRTVSPFQNGLAMVRVGNYSDDKGWDGYINKKGEFVWRPSDYKARDEAREKAIAIMKAERANPSIVILQDPASKEKGLLVTCPRTIPFNGAKAGQIPIQVINRLDEEVFLEVTGHESLDYALETWEGGSTSGGGGVVIFPDNTQLLKRLHATHYSEQGDFTCGCCSTVIRSTIPSDALESGRARGTVGLRISGYYRKSGKEFFELVELPIELVEAAVEVAPKNGKP